MSEIIREFEFDINFKEDKFERTDGSTEIITIVENDNKSTRFKFNFKEEIADGINVLVKIKHNTGFVKEYILNVENKKSELTLTNSILVAGTLKMTISYIGSNNEILTPTQYQNKILVKESITGETTIPEEDEDLLEGLISQVNLLNQETKGATTNANIATENANNAAQAATGAKTAIENTFEQIQEAYQQQVNTDASLELATARTNKDGITYANLKERLDSLDVGRGKIYGIKRKITNNNVATWTRIGDAVGLVANAQKGTTAVENDFDNCYPWSDIITCNVDRDTGKILAYLGEADFAFDGSNGEVYTKIPEFWWKRERKTDSNGDEYEYIYIADYAKADYNKSEEFLIARYNLSVDDDNLAHSVSGAVPKYNTNLATFRNYAKAMANTCLMDYRIFIIQMLYLVEYANYNSQSTLGNGMVAYTTATATVAEENTNKIIVSSVGIGLYVGKTICIGASGSWNSSVAANRQITNISDHTGGGKEITFSGDPVNTAVGNVIWGSAQMTGELDSLGMVSGCLVNDSYHSMIYRGIENIFGHIWQHVDGLNIKDYEAYICKEPSEYANDKFTTPYEKIGYINANTSDSYIKKLGYDKNYPEVALPVEVGGSSSTGACDNYWCSAGNRIAYVGGGFNLNWTLAGFFAWSCGNASSFSYWSYGARLLKYQS